MSLTGSRHPPPISQRATPYNICRSISSIPTRGVGVYWRSTRQKPPLIRGELMQGTENRIDINAIIDVLERMRDDPHSRSTSPGQKFYEALAMTDSTLQYVPEWRELSLTQQASFESTVMTLIYGNGRED